MTGFITVTGSKTFFGRTAKLVGAAGAASHSQRAVTQVGELFAAARPRSGDHPGRGPMLPAAGRRRRLELGRVRKDRAVCSGSADRVVPIPVALPAVMSVTMAIGAYALSLQKAIVSRLSAIEELAGVDVLCSDKTGTLTMNRLTVEGKIPFARLLLTKSCSALRWRRRKVARTRSMSRSCRWRGRARRSRR